jgi:transcription antitermination factor NusG
MTNPKVVVPFHEGDEVVLAEGTYQGTSGVFLRFDQDVKWAHIREQSGRVRNHPVAWLAHAASGRLQK